MTEGWQALTILLGETETAEGDPTGLSCWEGHGDSHTRSLLARAFTWPRGVHPREGELVHQNCLTHSQRAGGAVCTEVLIGTIRQLTFTTRSVPQVTIRPLATSMDMWEMLCFPSWKVARDVRLTERREAI